MRRRKFKKPKASELFSGIKETLAEKAAGIAVAAIFVILIFVLAKAFLYKSDYFRLRAIEVRYFAQDNAARPSIEYDELLAAYKGKNVFSINLKSIARFFESACPDARGLSAQIVLPDKIAVNIRPRRPAAFLKGERTYVIDDEGFMLSGIYGKFLNNMPVIEGVSTRPADRIGRTFTSNNLRAALGLLKELKAAKIPERFGVARIDGRDPKNLSFNISNGIEVRIGSEDIAGRLRVFEKTIRDPRLVLDRIDYIDVRFEDAVIGPK